MPYTNVFFMLLVDLDNFLLAAMAYDRYIAICHPLQYVALLSPKRCALLVVIPWVISNLVSVLHVSLLRRLLFCERRVVPHFFCDLEPMLRLACSDTKINNLLILVVGGAVIFIPFSFILLSYALIGAAVLAVPSVKGKWKTFSPCGSQLSAVSLFYGSIVGIYFLPASSYSAERDKVAAFMYTVVTPMMNPFIYSLRNTDVKRALRRLLSKRKFFLSW
ncbi:Olfactory receptor 1468 [Microtus ochrogaster]|uniref:Olfactory receptor n=1 Tax=Microtus ochrogaster TaxID=79684 RepID=A0A8J6KMD5_MICOH|nr:Olfactory receptor 1468 [Microtus ochrogaster]